MQALKTLDKFLQTWFWAAIADLPGQWEAHELERINIEYRVLTGDTDSADALANRIHEKAQMLKEISSFEYRFLLSMLHDEVRKRLAYGKPPEQVMQQVEAITEIDDLRNMALEEAQLWGVINAN